MDGRVLARSLLFDIGLDPHSPDTDMYYLYGPVCLGRDGLGQSESCDFAVAGRRRPGRTTYRFSPYYFVAGIVVVGSQLGHVHPRPLLIFQLAIS